MSLGPEHDVTQRRLLRVLAGEALWPPPIWLMRQAGRYLPEYRAVRKEVPDFLSLCFTPELAIEVTLQPIRRYGFDAAILFSDILVVPHALGQKVWFEEGRGPVLDPIRGVDGLRPDEAAGRLAPVMRTVAGLRRDLPAETALIGFAGAPWTVATYMVEGGGSRDHAATKGWAYADPAGFQRLIDILVETTAAYLIAQVDAGADALQLFDTWAGSLSHAEMRRWCLEPAKRIADAVHARHPRVPLIAFPRGIGAGYAAFAAEPAFAGLSLDTTVPVAWAAEALQPLKPVQGNLDPIALVTGGAALQDGVSAILDGFAGRPFVFNLGHGIVPQTPPDHVAALVAAVRSRG